MSEFHMCSFSNKQSKKNQYKSKQTFRPRVVEVYRKSCDVLKGADGMKNVIYEIVSAAHTNYFHLKMLPLRARKRTTISYIFGGFLVCTKFSNCTQHTN